MMVPPSFLANLPVEQLISPLPSPVFAAYGLLGPEIFGH